ncbi:protein argonaute-2-like isoform X4 [Lycorma delicatula]|uniref:protein argonaute-2-like isoform X4 n=1 Tax=Lycorma delicatula TaxID=130591 RepID=UPI003F5186EA
MPISTELRNSEICPSNFHHDSLLIYEPIKIIHNLNKLWERRRLQEGRGRGGGRGRERGYGRGRGRGRGAGPEAEMEPAQGAAASIYSHPASGDGDSYRSGWKTSQDFPSLGKRPESHHGPASMQHGGTSQFDFPSLSQSSSSEYFQGQGADASRGKERGRGIGRGRAKDRYADTGAVGIQHPLSDEPSREEASSGFRGRGGPKRQRGAHSSGIPPDYSSQVKIEQQSRSPSVVSHSSSQSSISEQAKRTPSDKQTPPPQASGFSMQSQRVSSQQKPLEKDISDITKKVDKLSVIPLRKSRGTNVVGKKGIPINLEVNHLALNLKKTNMVAIHYDVSFKPDKPKRLYRLIMQAFQRRYYPNNFPAFDGKKNLYSCGYLQGGQVINGTVTVKNEERGEDKGIEYEVTIKFAAKVDMSPLISYMNSGSSTSPPQEAIQAIDIVLRNPAAMRFVAVGRSFFTPPQQEQIVDLGDGLELWYGFYQSAILGWKPFLNVDVAHKGFPKPENLIKVIRDQNATIGDRVFDKELDNWQKESLQKYIGGLKVEYEIPNQPDSKRTYKVNRVLGSSINQRFDLVEKVGDAQRTKNISVGQYLHQYKNFRLRYPNMPCLHVGPSQRNIFVPVELCTIAKGQALAKKLNEKQTASMVRSAAQPADVRKRKILEAIRMADFNSDPCVRDFGISVADRFTPVSGRILNPPVLLYDKEEKRPLKGVWRAGKFLKGTSLRNWCILNLDFRTREDSLMKFAREMEKIGREVGVSIHPQPNIKHLVRKPSARKEEIVKELEVYKEFGAELVVVVIPDNGETYGRVKQAAELVVGILTQCVKAKTIYRLSVATVSNILLKVNSKLNGVNHTIGGPEKPMVLKRPVMIVGADVTHPSPDQNHIPSVAAVAASHDPKAFQYNMLWRLQPARKEIIEDLENIMRKQLLFFLKRTNHKPEKIFFYRDGVSEGQFSQVLGSELQAIRRACKGLEEGYEPKITFLVVQKRHHTRFFPTRREDEDGKNKNVPAGTIVDTTITHPTEFDFYLVSHASIQGTSRPTKYHLLWDDNDMVEDDLEELTYYLCHLFSRCTRSVSYPAPTYYAHLAAFRARVYLEGSRTSQNLVHEQEMREIRSVITDGSPMFFI